MDAEMFSTEQHGGRSWLPTSGLTRATVEPRDVQLATVKLLTPLKWCARVALVLLIVWTIVMVINAIPLMGAAWKSLFTKSSFTQKEGLQWLGASTDVVRGDYENNQDTLAETAMRQANQVTQMGDVARFTERLSTPEEELMKKLAA